MRTVVIIYSNTEIEKFDYGFSFTDRDNPY